jgi:hypothetical protein
MEFAPERDPDGSTARRLVQLLAQALPRRLRD